MVIVEPIDEDAPVLSPEDEAGIEAALESYARDASLAPGAPVTSSAPRTIATGSAMTMLP